MQQYSMDDVQAILDDLRSLPSGLFDRGNKEVILHAVANEPGYAANDEVRAYVQEVLRSFPLCQQLDCLPCASHTSAPDIFKENHVNSHVSEPWINNGTCSSEW